MTGDYNEGAETGELTDSDDDHHKEPPEERDGLSVGRRGVLTSAGLLGLLGLGVGTASASSKTPSGQIGTSGSPLNTLYTEKLDGGVTGDQELRNIAGTGLSIDGSGNLNASGGGSLSTLTTNKSITALKVLDGSTGVGSPAEASSPLDAPNIIGGHPDNHTDGSLISGATVAGGGNGGTSSNVVSGNFASVGGGIQNTASNLSATVSGGQENTASSQHATVGGGSNNTASGNVGPDPINTNAATVAGGKGNKASNYGATVGGGIGNLAFSPGSTVPGGYNNAAEGTNAFAAGTVAKAKQNGSFAWGDSSQTTVETSAEDEVRFQASGGFAIENSNSTTETVTLDGGLPSGNGDEDSVAIDGSGQLVANNSSGSSGERYSKIVNAGTDVTANPGDFIITNQTITVTLPSLGDLKKKTVIIKTRGTGNVTIKSPNPSYPIDGATERIIDQKYGSCEITTFGGPEYQIVNAYLSDIPPKP